MKTMNTFKRLLTVLFSAAAMSLAACGGGDSGSETAGDLPSGKVGTVGDGMNAAEFEAIQCGMNKDQVLAIVGDSPTEYNGDSIWLYKTPALFTSLLFNGNALGYKGTGPAGKPATAKVTC